MQCIRCGSEQTRKDGQTRLGGQRWHCNACHRRFTARSTSALARRAPHHGFPDDVIALAVRWYARYRLSYADVVEWFAERGLVVDGSTHRNREQHRTVGAASDAEVMISRLAREFPPLLTPHTRRNHLPLQLTFFVGHDGIHHDA